MNQSKLNHVHPGDLNGPNSSLVRTSRQVPWAGRHTSELSLHQAPFNQGARGAAARPITAVAGAHTAPVTQAQMDKLLGTGKMHALYSSPSPVDQTSVFQLGNRPGIFFFIKIPQKNN